MGYSVCVAEIKQENNHKWLLNGGKRERVTFYLPESVTSLFIRRSPTQNWTVN